MEDTRISFETAKLANEKGYINSNNKIGLYTEDKRYHPYMAHWLGNYKEFYLAPTQSLLQKWLREVHNIEVLISIFPKQMREKMGREKYCCYILNENWNPTVPSNGSFSSIYENSFELGLQEALNLLPNKD